MRSVPIKSPRSQKINFPRSHSRKPLNLKDFAIRMFHVKHHPNRSGEKSERRRGYPSRCILAAPTFLTGAKRRIFFLAQVQGPAPAEGSVKPTAGFTLDKVCCVHALPAHPGGHGAIQHLLAMPQVVPRNRHFAESGRARRAGYIIELLRRTDVEHQDSAGM